MLNDRLAQHYGIAGVEGVEFRRVPLPPGSVRGGVLTQASVLKVTATAPHIAGERAARGCWTGSWASPRAPPPNVPAIEPDIRGAQSIRDQLAKHRTGTACAACHAKIDPPGFRPGTIRRHRRCPRPVPCRPGDRAGAPASRRRREAAAGNRRPGSVSTPAERCPTAGTFGDFEEFRSLLAADPDQLTRTLASKLLTYATGTAPQYADRARSSGSSPS